MTPTEFERNPSKVDPEIEKKIPGELPKRELYSEIGQEKVQEFENDDDSGSKQQPADRLTGVMPDIERDQQPVVGHQDRRHK